MPLAPGRVLKFVRGWLHHAYQKSSHLIPQSPKRHHARRWNTKEMLLCGGGAAALLEYRSTSYFFVSYYVSQSNTHSGSVV